MTETLRKHPTLNSQFADDKIILKQAMNIGIAVAVDNGLIVPVIANADQLSISGVNARIRDISSRAHAGKLRLDELQGGTFTVNNTGWFGSVVSMPIINAPEVAILSMEAIVKRPRVIEVDGEDVIAIRHMMNMTCSFDHRVLDGAQVGFFLADVRSFLEEWDAEQLDRLVGWAVRPSGLGLADRAGGARPGSRRRRRRPGAATQMISRIPGTPRVAAGTRPAADAGECGQRSEGHRPGSSRRSSKATWTRPVAV